MRRLALAVVLALAIAPAASAAPGDRAAARQIRQATIDLHVAVHARAAAIHASYDQLLNGPGCGEALKNTPGDQSSKLMTDYIVPLATELEFVPLQLSFDAFAARLETIPMRDARLRSGRAGWRALAGELRQVAPPPPDFCGTLDAWAKAGYPAASRPRINDPQYDRLTRPGNHVLDSVEAKIERAGRRLRALGVSKRVVDWYTTSSLLDEVEPVEIVGGDDGS
jgi:hypothetical protein